VINLVVIDLLLQISETGGMVHRDGQPFTSEERARVMRATRADQEAVDSYHRNPPSSVHLDVWLGV
jgi:hypothetical protein